MSVERPGAATVLSQDGSGVHVEHQGRQLGARMAGFPPGFSLRPGERVILVDEQSGVTARPLVRTLNSPASRDALEHDREVSIDDQRYVMQDSTVVEFEPSRPSRGDDLTTLWVVEGTVADEPAQVIAIRSPLR